MTTTVTDATAADMAGLARLREGLAAHFGEAVQLTAEETAACVSPPHHAELFVREEVRGRGMGRALLEAALERFAARGLTEVSVSTFPDNEGALRLYRSLGFGRELVTLEKDITRAPAASGRLARPPEEDRCL